MDSGVDIRPLGRNDRSAFARFFDRLSMDSRYKRFFAPIPRLPERTLDSMVDVDGRRHSAVAAWRDDELIGEARYVAFADESAEVAVSVRDDWQRHGIGTVMLLRVMSDAARNGFCRLTANSLAQNNGVRTLLSRAGFVRTGTEAGTSEWERNACPVVTVV
ncbi:MAG TPA: GNAT family N-acetyltransferase [Thermoleophilaceae bacterium]|nr:GNAT family N-acetyltransferase [Thermoleophilaceae bacterium]